MRSMTKTRRPEGSPRPFAGGILGALVLGVLALGGCGDLQPVATFEPETDPAALYGSLTLDHRAINLSTEAPYDTIQLTATPRNMKGEPLEGLPAPTFRSSDTASVWVTPEGLVQARKATSGVQVIAEVVTGDNVRHADTAVVKVTSTATPPELASFEITFSSPEQVLLPMSTDLGAYIGAFFSFAGAPSPVARTVSVTAQDGAGNPVPGLEIDYVSLNPRKVVVNRRSGVVEQVVGPPGEEVAIIARTTAYGVVRADTAVFSVTGPAAHGTLISTGGDGAPLWLVKEFVIRPGGVVGWQYFVNGSGEAPPIGITFEDPTEVEAVPELCAALGVSMPHFCEAGDIVIPEGFLLEMRVRRFPKPGIYEFETTDGVQGRVRVVEDDDPFWDAARSGE